MTILTRLSLRADWRNELRAMFPRVTDKHLDRFAILAERDNIVTDKNEPTLAFIGWCREVTA